MLQFIDFNGYVKECGVYINTKVEVQWDVYMQFGRKICSGAYASNVKCMYAVGHGHIVHCIEFMRLIH